MGANEVAVIAKNELWTGEGFTQKGVDLLRKSIAKDATDIELQMFLHLCGQYKLDPFLKEIYFMKRKVWNPYKNGYDEVPTMMVSRDGFLAIAHKSGHFDGMETVSLYDPDSKVLKGAKCTVYNNAMTHPITQSVLFSEYCVYTKAENGKPARPQGLWATKPETMVKKVAEAQALRKAFNIHGVYLQEEMEAEIAKEAMGEIENIAETIKTAEAVHSTEGNYDKWAEETMTHILDALQACKTDKDVWKVEKDYDKDIKTLVDKDREYIMDMIASARQNCISGDQEEPTDAVPLTQDRPEEAAHEESSQKGPAKEVMSEKQKADLKAREGFGKKWLPDAVKAIQACTTKAQVQSWKHNNIADVMKLLPEGRDYIKTIYQEQFDKVKDK